VNQCNVEWRYVAFPGAFLECVDERACRAGAAVQRVGEAELRHRARALLRQSDSLLQRRDRLVVPTAENVNLPESIMRESECGIEFQSLAALRDRAIVLVRARENQSEIRADRGKQRSQC